MKQPMKKPDFFIVGAPKCGTTSLKFYLEQHPEIFISNPGEPCFFCPDIITPRVKTTEEYLNLFQPGKDKICGEKSTRYLFSEIAPQKIYELNPKAKIIIMLREPVSFMHSWHNELLMWFIEDIEDFKSALDAEDDRRNGRKIPVTCKAPKQLLYREFAQFSRYIEIYLSIFEREKVHFLILDDMKKNPYKSYKDILTFLEVDPDFIPNLEIQNKNKNIANMHLHSFFRTPPIFLKRISRYILPNELIRKKTIKNVISLVEKINVQRKPRKALDQTYSNELKKEFSLEIDHLGKLINKDLSMWK